MGHNEPNNYPPPVFGRYAKEDPTARFPPRTVQPGPPLGQDYFTLTAKHGRPQGRFEQHVERPQSAVADEGREASQ